MTEETEFETYLSITPNKFGIYVFDTKTQITYMMKSSNYKVIIKTLMINF